MLNNLLKTKILMVNDSKKIEMILQCSNKFILTSMSSSMVPSPPGKKM